MGRASGISRDLAVAQAVVATPATPCQMLLGVSAYGVSIRLAAGSTGTLAGAFKLQVTDFGVSDDIRAGQPPATADWADVASSSQTWAGSTLVWSVANPGNKFLRVVFVDAGSVGAPTVDIRFTGNCWEP